MYTIKDLKNFIFNNSPIRIIKNKIFTRKFMNTPLQKFHLVVFNSDLDIYIIAFNKPSLIEDQIQLLKKNLKDNYRLIIIDNSNKTEESQKIENICRNNNTSYFKLPENKLTASHSHALALNYTMKRIISNQNTPYI